MLTPPRQHSLTPRQPFPLGASFIPEGMSPEDDLKDHWDLFWSHLTPALMTSMSKGRGEYKTTSEFSAQFTTLKGLDFFQLPRKVGRVLRALAGCGTHSVSSVTQSCLTLCDPMNCTTSGFLVLQQIPEFTQTHGH